MQEQRIKTDIPGVDELIEGGLIPNSLTLVTGTTGTGKTLFSSQFLWNGIKQNQPGLYVTFEEPPENIKKNVLNFGWDFSKPEKQNKILFVRYDPFHVEDIYELIESNIKKINAQRVVIDSVSALGLYIRDAPEIRRMVLNTSLLLRKLKCTSILTSEILPEQKSLSRFGVEEFISDGIIVLYHTRTDSQYARSMTVWTYQITDKGIEVYPKEEAFVKM
jgi:KaiC/GvpD/RAD55 family RecA-like ATPase